MNARTAERTEMASGTRLDITDCPVDRIGERVRRNRVRGAEIHLERKGGRTYLVASPGR